LRRTAVGTFTLTASHPVERFDSRDAVVRALLPPDRAILDWSAVVLSPAEARAVRMGQLIKAANPVSGRIRLYDGSGDLVGLGEALDGRIKAFRVLRGE
jgi:tRNA U55 pseudouridine synthase TruB